MYPPPLLSCCVSIVPFGREVDLQCNNIHCLWNITCTHAVACNDGHDWEVALHVVLCNVHAAVVSNRNYCFILFIVAA